MRDDDYIRLNAISDFIEDFVAPESKERLHYLLSKPSRREHVIGYFESIIYLDSRYMHPIPRRERSAEKIYEMLQKLGARPQCCVLSLNKLFENEADLKIALFECVGTCLGSIIYCREAKLGYIESYATFEYEGCLLCRQKIEWLLHE